jgi:hypothetical protein
MSQLPPNPSDKYNGLSRATFYRHKTKRELSDFNEQKKRAFDEIEKQGDISLLACEHCYKHGIRCVVMEGGKSTRCASCAAKGIKCVNISWTSLDKTREETKAAINEDLQRLEEITARLAQNRRVLELAEKRAKAKAVCLLDEIEEKEEAERVKNGGMTDAELEELSRNFVAYHNASENAGSDVFSAWDSARGASPGAAFVSPVGSSGLTPVG